MATSLFLAGVTLIAAGIGAAIFNPVVGIPAITAGVGLLYASRVVFLRESAPLSVAPHYDNGTGKARAYLTVVNPITTLAHESWGQLLAICRETPDGWERLECRQVNLAWSPLHAGEAGRKSLDITGGARAELNVGEAFDGTFFILTAPRVEGWPHIPTTGRYVFRISVHADGRRSCREDFLLTVTRESSPPVFTAGILTAQATEPQIRFELLPAKFSAEARLAMAGGG